MSRDQLQISEAQLSAMTTDLDDLHRSTFPEVLARVADFAYRPSSRRSVLLGAGGVAVLGAVAACGSSDDTATPSTSSAASPTKAAGATYEGDLKIVALAAALENLAVTAYGGALAAAGKGTLGTVPKAVATFIQVAMKQHTDHAAVWNSVLTKAGKPAVTGAPLSITADQVAKLGQAKSVGDVATLALNLENAAAQTYTFATANVSDPGGISVASTIQPVEAMHAAILSFVLGKYPVPDAFVGVSGAVGPDALTL
ncbi:hypothetical protein F4553_007349 [Allocatelliglobosispora scoriae]|uniref:Ferritin-like domain-containing protein n=1 Tax=Allocatelliglobosispora scoriae TaxID=643052 RepID=A0A841C1V9_9ACTN|nr:ferritin-like domain-containing protein [Allocatelliglobosispora scoriae]MBB5873915.1 hypothetical protein [Allocatelliglobosispora scoriae]